MRQTRSTARRRHRLLGTLAVLGVGLLIAACGSSAKPSPRSHRDVMLAFSECMRSHGVTNFPDPSSGGGIHLGSGMNPFAPAFKAAQSSCAKLLPGGGPGAQHPSAQQIDQTRQVSVCMRQHGVSGFPDPTLRPPSSPVGYSLVEDRGGVVLALPSTINPQSPAFQKAAKACGFS
jgi:hypothetical protein